MTRCSFFVGGGPVSHMDGPFMLSLERIIGILVFGSF